MNKANKVYAIKHDCVTTDLRYYMKFNNKTWNFLYWNLEI